MAMDFLGPDPDRTVASDAPTGPPVAQPLPVGHALQEYVIEGLVGEGGFGIVYRARDTQLGRVVAVKEYMPSSLARRRGGATVTPRSQTQQGTFELGRRSFVNEARLLAAFDQPSLVKVYRFWEENGTAYMVMPYYQGPTLRQFLAEHGAPTEAWLRRLLAPLIDALALMHANRCYHRDIAPDNILLVQPSSTTFSSQAEVLPVLLDFGAARRVISDATQALTVFLKPGYAPIEQYAESTSIRQGPWTDVYALCAVLYAAITGHAPPPSVSRIVEDELVPAAEAGAGRYGPAFLDVIDAGLAVRPEHRPPDMPALRRLLADALQADAGAAPQARKAGLFGASPMPSRGPHVEDLGARHPAGAGALDDARRAGPASIAAPTQSTHPVDALAGIGWLPDGERTLAEDAPTFPSHAADRAPSAGGAPLRPIAHPAGEDDRPAHAKPSAATSRASAPRITGAPWVLLAAGLAVAGSLAWWSATRDPAPSRVAAPPAAVAPPASVVTPADASGAVPPAEAPPPTPFSVMTALNDIVRQADPLLAVNALTDRSRLRIGHDRLQFRIKSKEPGHVYVFLSGTDKRHFYLLFPNEIDRDNRIAANTEVTLPRKGWAVTAGGPPGTNHIVTVVSRQPLDLGAVGLRAAGDEIPEFDLAQAEGLWAARQPGRSPFLGRVLCEGEAPCDTGYGASLLEVEEFGP
ncbi:protein kinase domain-containing protein [Rhizobacter sp. LjRoot28]|uniref:protein kinase domain-containing protein n=1 Tax=Rhizobacter sp. LjRoot28 TaxID=3342309 RepID=UPI003ECEE53A